jgi:prevent-host-death family protein
MISIAAKEAKDHFGEMLDTVQRERVRISKKGRAVAVIMSEHEYARIEAIEAAAWAAWADVEYKNAVWLSPEESMRVIQETINRAEA